MPFKDLSSGDKRGEKKERDRYSSFRRASKIKDEAMRIRKKSAGRFRCDRPLLQKLIGAFGVSGAESTVRGIISNEIKKYCDALNVDKMGNLVALKRGTGKGTSKGKIMFAAHMDEIGLIVKSISEEGKIHVSSVGGFDVMSLVGQRVYVHGKKEKIYGALTTDELSDGLDVSELPKVEDVYIDTGFSGSEILRRGVKIGSYVEFEESGVCKMCGYFIFGKALDDRIGCYILIELIKRIERGLNDVYFVFTVQEEIGLYGSRTSAFDISPDWAVVVDVTDSNENSSNPTKVIGGGPTITVKDAEMLGNRCMDEWLEDIGRRKKIPIQLDVSDFGTTDALSISLSRGGVPVAQLGVPIRGIHTTFAIANLKDIEDSIKLLLELLRKPPQICIT